MRIALQDVKNRLIGKLCERITLSSESKKQFGWTLKSVHEIQ